MFHIYGWTEGQGNKWSHTGGRLPWDIHTDKHIKANAAPELSALISWYPWQQHIHSCIRSHPLSQVSLSLPLSHTHTQAHILFRSSMYSCRTEGECESKSRKMRTVKHVCKSYLQCKNKNEIKHTISVSHQQRRNVWFLILLKKTIKRNSSVRQGSQTHNSHPFGMLCQKGIER